MAVPEFCIQTKTQVKRKVQISTPLSSYHNVPDEWCRTLTAVHNVITIPLRVCASIFAKIHRPTDYLMLTPVVFSGLPKPPARPALTFTLNTLKLSLQKNVPFGVLKTKFYIWRHFHGKNEHFRATFSGSKSVDLCGFTWSITPFIL